MANSRHIFTTAIHRDVFSAVQIISLCLLFYKRMSHSRMFNKLLFIFILCSLVRPTFFLSDTLLLQHLNDISCKNGKAFIFFIQFGGSDSKQTSVCNITVHHVFLSSKTWSQLHKMLRQVLQVRHNVVT